MKSLKFLAFVALFIGVTTAVSAQSTAPVKPRVNAKMKYAKTRPATAETAPTPPPATTSNAPAPAAPRAETSSAQSPAAPAPEVMQARVKKMGKLQKKG
jgi:hypothetical protein